MSKKPFTLCAKRERRKYPPARADWCTADYVREYFLLNTKSAFDGINAYGDARSARTRTRSLMTDHLSLYLPLGTTPQAPDESPIVDEGVTP